MFSASDRFLDKNKKETKDIMRLMLYDLEKSLSNFNGGPFVASIFGKNNILRSIGCNSVLLKNDPSAHAEVTAIRNTGRLIGDFNLKEFNMLSSHAPCLMCYHAIKWAGIDTLYYLFDYSDTKEMFGFDTDLHFCNDLGFDDELDIFEKDLSLNVIKLNDEELFNYFKDELINIWENYKNKLSCYDIRKEKHNASKESD